MSTKTVVEYALEYRKNGHWVEATAQGTTTDRRKANRWLSRCNGQVATRGVSRAIAPENARLIKRTITTVTEIV